MDNPDRGRHSMSCDARAQTLVTMNSNPLKFKMAEREGFEPTVVFSYSRFPGVRLKPLSHLSVSRVKVAKLRAWRNVFLPFQSGNHGNLFSSALRFSGQSAVTFKQAFGG